MKSQAPEPEQMFAFGRLQIVLLLTLSVAFIIWEVQDFAASFAATEMTTQTTLRTTKERDDTRVQQSFNQARQSLRVNATLQTEPNLQQQTRDAILVVTAKSKTEVLQAREQMVQAMQASFKADGGDELFDVGNAPNATPVPNDACLQVKRCFRFGALAIVLAGLVQMGVGWKRSKLPLGALLGIVATVCTIGLYALGREATPFFLLLLQFGLPIAVLVLLGVVTQRVLRARSWQEGRALIKTSKVQVERHRFAGDTTKVRNLPCVEYEFEVPGKGKFVGDKISVGFGTADNVDVVLKRYPVGASVPVFYDPLNPEQCVLERAAPVSLGCLWSGGILFAALYVAIALSLMKVISIDEAMMHVLPSVHHPLIVLITGFLGLLALAAGIWNMLHPRQAFPWTQTKGRIVISETESFRDTDSSSGRSSRLLYRPVIEFSYEVEGQEYRGTNASAAITMASSKAWADGEVARYPVGMEVTVYYNPQNHSQSGLNVNTDLTLNGRSSLVVAAILLAVAYYAATHGW